MNKKQLTIVFLVVFSILFVLITGGTIITIGDTLSLKGYSYINIIVFNALLFTVGGILFFILIYKDKNN